MTGNSELVTVAIPTRNRLPGLVKALSGVIAQTYKNLEIIVSDNNSQGDVKTALSAFTDTRIKYFKHGKDLSMTENWNFCLEQASGDYFLLLSDDDQLEPDAVDTLLKALLSGKAALAYGRAVFRGEAGERLGLSRGAPQLESGAEFISATLSGKRNPLPSGTLFRAEAARSLGGYPETGSSTDLALCLALATRGAVAYSPGPLLEYSIHSGGLTFDHAKTEQGFLKLAAWAAAPSSPLNKWAGEAAGYCAGALRAKARACALRGDTGNAISFLKASNLIAPVSSLSNFLVEVFSWAPVRFLSGVKRKAGKSAAGLLLPVFFCAGYLVSAGFFPSRRAEYLLLNVLAASAAWLAFNSLAKRRGGNIAAWLVFFVLLVFGYAKFYWLLLAPGPVKEFFPEGPAWNYLGSPAVLLEAFLMQTLGFSAFCFSLPITLKFMRTREAPVREPLKNLKVFLRPFLALITGGFFVSVFLVQKYKVGLLGMPSAPLPFHLSGLIFYLQTMALPIMLVTFIHLSEKAEEYWWSRTGMLLFAAWAAADALLRGSRASLMLVPLLGLFLALSGGIKVRKAESAAVLGMGFLAVFLSPLIWGYRVCRLSGLDSFSALISSISSFSPSFSGLTRSITFIFFRVPGIETSAIVAGSAMKPLGLKTFETLFFGGGFSWYLGQAALGLPPNAANAFATPFIAQWHMAGGYAGIILAGAAAAVLSAYAWDRLVNLGFAAAPVTRAFFLLLLFWALTEGVSPALVKQTLVFLAVTLLLESGVRKFSK